MISIIVSIGDLELMPLSRILLNYVLADDEEKDEYEGLKFNKTLGQRAETKNYKPKVVLEDNLVKTFSPETPKCATERVREELLGDEETLERSCKRALGFDSGNIEKDDLVAEAVNSPVYAIQTADSFPCSQTFSGDPSSSKKLGPSSVPSKILRAKLFPYFFAVNPANVVSL